MDFYSIDFYVERTIKFLIAYSPKVIAALLTLIIGLFIIKMFRKLMTTLMTKREMEPTLLKFLTDLFTWVMRILLFVSVVTKLGVETSSFVAIIGAASLAVGLSLQGSLSNFAGGMLIILFKPFKVGHTIEAQGVNGIVMEIQIFVTRILTGNGQTVFVPNGALSNGVITNFTYQGNRRAELTISISYSSDVTIAMKIIQYTMEENPLILKEPAPAVAIKELGANVILVIRPWAKNADFGNMTSEILRQCKEALQNGGIEIPNGVSEIKIKND